PAAADLVRPGGRMEPGRGRRKETAGRELRSRGVVPNRAARPRRSRRIRYRSCDAATRPLHARARSVIAIRNRLTRLLSCAWSLPPGGSKKKRFGSLELHMDALGAAVLAIVAAALGIGGALLVSRRGLGGGASLSQAQLQADQVVAGAEAQKKELLLEAKEEAIRVKMAAEADVRSQLGEVKAEQQRLRNREEQLDRKIEGFENREHRLQGREQEIERKASELEELRASELKE